MIDTMQTKNVDINERSSTVIRWGAVFGGLGVAFIFMVLLNLLGTGLGFLTFEPNKAAMTSLGMGAIIWAIAISIISSYAGGWVSGFFSGSKSKKSGFFHGLILSGVSLFIMVVLLFSAVGSVLGGASTLLSKSMSSTKSIINDESSVVIAAGKSLSGNSSSKSSSSWAQTADQAKTYLPEKMGKEIDTIKNEIENFVSSTKDAAKDKLSSDDNKRTIEDAQAKAMKEAKNKVLPAFNNFIHAINTDNAEQAREELLSVLSKATGKSKSELQDKVNKWEKMYLEAKAKTIEATKKTAAETAELISHFALINFFVLLLGTLASALGGCLGVCNVTKRRSI